MLVPGLKEMWDELKMLDKAPKCPYCGQKMRYNKGLIIARYVCECGSGAPWVSAKADDCQRMAYEAAMKRVKE